MRYIIFALFFTCVVALPPLRFSWKQDRNDRSFYTIHAVSDGLRKGDYVICDSYLEFMYPDHAILYLKWATGFDPRKIYCQGFNNTGNAVTERTTLG